jgi:uncharacterized lipoprotein YddW (UPF0748 family)
MSGVMRRRDFVEAVAAAAVVGVVPRESGRTRRLGARDLENWAWVPGGRERTAAEWRAHFARLREAGISGVLVSGGELPLVSDAARSAGLRFHRWIWTLNRNGDAWAREHHPEWFTVSRNGDSSLVKPPYVNYYRWVCPTRPEVRAYLREVVDELAKSADVDGVHLDYVRHCDVILPHGLWAKYGLVQDRELPEFDFCYCDVCRQTFARESGHDPLELPDPAADPDWRRFRWDSVTGLVRELADAVHARGRMITAAVFPTPTIARTLVRQSWDEWPLDAVFPMLYHRFYEEDVPWIGRSTAEDVTAVAAGRPVYSGLYLADLTPEELATAVHVAVDAGASGVSLFNAAGLTDERLSAFRGSIAG